jgi:hypothetical protein
MKGGLAAEAMCHFIVPEFETVTHARKEAGVSGISDSFPPNNWALALET